MLQTKKDSCTDKNVSRINKEGSEIVVSSSKDVRSGENERFGTAKACHDVIGLHGQGERGARPQRLVEPAVQLAKGWLSGNPHPYRKVLVLHSFNRTNDLGVGFVEVLRGVIVRVEVTVAGFRSIRVAFAVRFSTGPVVSLTARVVASGTNFVTESFRLLVQVINVGLPGNSSFDQLQSISESVLLSFLKLDDIIKQCVGHLATGVESNDFAGGGIAEFVQGFAATATDGISSLLSGELKVVPRYIIRSMVLVKVGELIIKKNGREHVLWNGKGNIADSAGIEVRANATGVAIFLHCDFVVLIVKFKIIVRLFNFNDTVLETFYFITLGKWCVSG